MLRSLIPLAVAVATFLPARADACTMEFVDFFTNYEAATTVARVEVTAVDSAGAVTMRRGKTLKGATTGTLTGKQGGMCPPSYSEGQDVIAFFDATGRATWIEGNPKLLETTLATWKKTRSAAARTRLLRAWAKGKNQTLKVHAIERLRRDALATTTAPAAAPAWAAPDPAWKAPGTAKAAVARFHAVWPAVKAAAPTGLTRFDEAMTSGAHRCEVSAVAQPAAEVAKMIADVGVPPELGSVAELTALGTAKVWGASCSVGFFSANGYLRSTDGALVVLWLPPEG